MKRRAFLNMIGLGFLSVPVIGRIVSAKSDGQEFDGGDPVNWEDPINHPLSSRRSVYPPRLYDKVQYRGEVYLVVDIKADRVYLSGLDPERHLILSIDEFRYAGAFIGSMKI